MGRARNNKQTVSLGLILRRRPQLSGHERYQEFVRTHLQVSYLTSDLQVQAMVTELNDLTNTPTPTAVSVDFETASKNGYYGVMNGALSLIQIGVDDAAQGISPRQWLIDCQQCNPEPVVALLENPAIPKLIHYLDFELEWSKVHLGVRTITPIYDTCIAWQVINKKLKSLPLAEAQRLLPGWEKHNNKLGTLVEHYLELEIPKGDQGSDWGARPLAAHQIIYAATDVAVLPYLAARTREISEALGVSAEVEARIKYVKQKVHKRAGRERKDDFERVSAALLRSLDRAEIDAVWQASRRMTLSAASTKEIQKLYQRRLAAVDN